MARGVLEFNETDTGWDVTDIDQESIDDDIVPARLCWVESQNRLFMAGREVTDVSRGGVWFIDFDDGSPEWSCIYGEDGPVGGTWTSTSYGGVTSIATDSDGVVLYIGTRGGSGRHGGIWKSTTLGASAANFVWTAVLHDPGWAATEDNTVPYVDDTPKPVLYEGRDWDTSEEIAEREARIIDILVDPYDDDRIWFINGPGGNPNRLSTGQGLYALDTDVNGQVGDVVKVFNEEKSWMAESVFGSVLMYTSETTPGRIVFGTHATGVMWFTYGSSSDFPTSN